jgi:hypothetical protein
MALPCLQRGRSGREDCVMTSVTVGAITYQRRDDGRWFQGCGVEMPRRDWRWLDEIERLRQLIDSLDIVVMQPDMSGEHQCTIRANGRKLTREQWDTILSTRDAS